MNVKKLIAVAAVAASVILPSRAEDYTGSPYELTADLTVTAGDTVAANMTFDTKGHTLTLAPEHFGGSTYFIVRSTVAGGVLKVVVPDGVTITNKSVALGGATNLQLHKYGAGKLVMERENTGFGGVDGSAKTSIVVYEGVVKKANVSGRASCGAQYSFIEVKDGGQFDIGGRTYHDYSYRFEGDGPEGAAVPGALVNTDTSTDWWDTKNPAYLCGMQLTGDATIGGTASWAQAFYFAQLKNIAMNGHVLTYKGNLVASGNRRYVGNGDIVVASGQFQSFTMTYANNDGAATGIVDMSASNCTFTVQNDALYAQHDRAISPVKTLVFNERGMFRNIYTTYPTMVVFEKYAPNLIASPLNGSASAPHPKVQLGDASHLATTLDLSLWSSPFHTVTNGLTLTTFQSGSVVTVDVASRRLSVGEKLIGWSSIPSATFALSSSDDTKDVIPRDDGLYVKAASPAYATLDTSVTPNVWRFFKADGTSYPDWTDGVTGDIQVRITSYAEYAAIKEMDGLSPASFLMTGTIAMPSGEGVVDMSDCSYDFASGDLTFDANGRQLKLPNSMIGGSKTFTVTSSVAGGVLVVEVGSGATVVNNNMVLTGGANLQLWKTGAGTLVMNRANTGFGAVERDSVVVKAGIVRKSSSSGVASCGVAWSFIRVENGGQFDIAGRSYGYYTYFIEGNGPEGAAVSGALVNTISVVDPWQSKWPAWLGSIHLTGNATIGGSEIWTHGFQNDEPMSIFMNGHTLTYTASSVMTGHRRYAGEGEIVVASGQFQSFMEHPNCVISASNCTITVQSGATYAQHDYAVSPVKSLLFSAGAKFSNVYANSSTTATPKPLNIVFETYAPNLLKTDASVADHPTVQLGAEGYLTPTLDLSLFSGPFDASETTFYSGSTVSLKIGERSITRGGMKIVAWSVKPDNVGQIRFVRGDADLHYSVFVKNDGIYIRNVGFIVIVK